MVLLLGLLPAMLVWKRNGGSACTEYIVRTTELHVSLGKHAMLLNTVCEHFLDKPGTPEAQALGLSHTGSCMPLLQAGGGKPGLDRSIASQWTLRRLCLMC